jgi:hypothetical protein
MRVTGHDRVVVALGDIGVTIQAATFLKRAAGDLGFVACAAAATEFGAVMERFSKPVGGGLQLGDAQLTEPPFGMAVLDAFPSSEIDIGEAARCLAMRRHSFASEALSASYTRDQIAELFGRASMETTRRYAHLIHDKKRQAAVDIARQMEMRLSAKG